MNEKIRTDVIARIEPFGRMSAQEDETLFIETGRGVIFWRNAKENLVLLTNEQLRSLKVGDVVQMQWQSGGVSGPWNYIIGVGPVETLPVTVTPSPSTALEARVAALEKRLTTLEGSATLPPRFGDRERYPEGYRVRMDGKVYEATQECSPNAIVGFEWEKHKRQCWTEV